MTSPTKEPTAKVSPAKASPARQPTARKASVKKAASKKSVSKKSPAKSAAVKKSKVPDSPGTPLIDGTTRVIGILGDPIDHTLSPRMHNAAFAELGLNYVYVPFRTRQRKLRHAIRSIDGLGIVGYNVTVPFKEKVIRYLDGITETAQQIGAVNTIYTVDGELVGDNTDAGGFRQALAAHGCRIRGKRVLVIGAGGSARAIVQALTAGGASHIVIANRTVAKATRLARSFDRRMDRTVATNLEILDDFDFLESRQLVVNCTSVGLEGGSFLDYSPESTPPDCLHFDLAYKRGLTPFLEGAAAVGRPVIDGRHMLLHQGTLAFKLFTGRRAPVETMAAAIGIKVG